MELSSVLMCVSLDRGCGGCIFGTAASLLLSKNESRVSHRFHPGDSSRVRERRLVRRR